MITRNRGGTWSAANVGAIVTLRAVRALSATTLLAVGDSGAMWMSTNSGAAWLPVTPHGLSANLRGISFVDANTGVVVGDDGLIIKTTDGGRSWARQSVNTFANLRAVFCHQDVDGSNWMAVGD